MKRFLVIYADGQLWMVDNEHDVPFHMLMCTEGQVVDTLHGARMTYMNPLSWEPINQTEPE